MNWANLLTSLNLASGTLAICLGDPYIGGLLIILGAIFDLFDGYVARLTKKDGALGEQLDSLADVITFGVAPGVLYYHARPAELDPTFAAIVVIFLVAGTAWRLATFNVLPPSAVFRGLPSPASGLFFASWLISIQYLESWFIGLHANPVIYLALPLVFAALMNIRAPFFSAKNFSKKGRKALPYLTLVMLTTLYVVTRPLESGPLAIFTYILLSVFFFPRNRHTDPK
ncbi:MAG: hypothetical protein GVX78_02395 [Bacteroidetes bacterium]|jgi:CDP-diacylglycerol--serine O-phosphatidyltransferase|nr:hypothetical protein [Bacteroidota bacterium]